MPDKVWVDIREAADICRVEKIRRRIKRFLQVFYLLLLETVVLVIARSTYLENRWDALALSDPLVEVLGHQVLSQVDNHLSPASELVELAAGIYQSKRWEVDAENLFEDPGIQFLAVHPQIQPFQVGVKDGRFLMTRRTPDHSVDTKVIKLQDDARMVRWVRRDPEGRVVAIETDPNDQYDPRDRPWYEGAVKEDRLCCRTA